MRVDGPTNPNYNKIVPTRPRARAAAQEPAKPFSPDGSPRNAPENAPTEQRGVIRLLQEGHFRGVADVRLRINFAEVLQGIQAVNTSALLQDELPAIKQQLNGAIDAFLTDAELDENALTTLQGARQDFNARLDALIGGKAAENGIASDVFAELRTAFSDFLNALLPPQEEDSSETGLVTTSASASPAATDTVDPPETPTDLFATLRETLSTLFEDALGTLEESADALALPPLSDPSGNGAAFDKFLEIYNELYGVGVEESGAPDSGLDTIS